MLKKRNDNNRIRSLASMMSEGAIVLSEGDDNKLIINGETRPIAEGTAVIVASMAEIEELNRLSTTDYLTGVSNRKSGEESIETLLKKRIPGYFCMVDIDHFKSINDTFGHQVGDKVLQAVAESVNISSLVACRLGGDEFCAFIPSKSFDAIVLDGFVRKYFFEIENHRIPEMGNTPFTISIGVIYYDGLSEINFDGLYREADKLLYSSKESIGNTYEYKTIQQIHDEQGSASERFQDERSRLLAKAPIGRLLWQFASPCIIAMTSSSIYNICDSIFIGRGAGALAIAGLAITFPLMNISTAIGALASVGSAAQTSVHMGMRDRRTAQLIFGNMLSIVLILGSMLTAAGLIFIDEILGLFGASAEVMPYAREYMQVILLGTIINHAFLGLCGQLRATGNPNKAMTGQLVAVVANLILDPIFIFQFHLGLRGAAIATVLGQLIALVYVMHQFFGRHHYVYLHAKVLSFRADIVRKIMSIGVAPFLVNISGCLIVVVINRMLMQQGGAQGDLYVGGYGIVNRITQLLIMVVSGFSQGMQPIVGFNIGAKLIDRVRKALRISLMVATAIMTSGYAFVAAFPAQLAMLFTDNQEMIDLCVPALRIALCTFPFVGSQMIAVTFFQSVRKAKMSIYISLTRQLFFLLPMLLILPTYLGVNGVWWSMSLSDIFSVALSWCLLYMAMKKLKAMQLENER